MRTGKGRLDVYLPGPNYVGHYGYITLKENRVSIISDKNEERDYPSDWCSIYWDKKEEQILVVNRECTAVGCYRDASPETGYCGNHSLYR